MVVVWRAVACSCRCNATTSYHHPYHNRRQCYFWMDPMKKAKPTNYVVVTKNGKKEIFRQNSRCSVVVADSDVYVFGTQPIVCSTYVYNKVT